MLLFGVDLRLDAADQHAYGNGIETSLRDDYVGVFLRRLDELLVHKETPWTRIIEHKWFEFGKDENGEELPKTIISREYSSEWKPGEEPYYPVNNEKNAALYARYKEMAEKENKVIFGAAF